MTEKKKKTFKLKSLTDEPVRKSNSYTRAMQIKTWRKSPIDPASTPPLDKTIVMENRK